MGLSRREALRYGAAGVATFPLYQIRPTGAVVGLVALASGAGSWIWQNIDKFASAANAVQAVVSIFSVVKSAQAAPLDAQVALAGHVSQDLRGQPAFFDGLAAIRDVVREELDRANTLKLIAEVQAIAETVKDFVLVEGYTPARIEHIHNQLLQLTPKVLELGGAKPFVIFPAYTLSASLQMLLARETVSNGRAPNTSLVQSAHRHRETVERWLSPDDPANPSAMMANLRPRIDEISKELSTLVAFPLLRNCIRVQIPSKAIKDGKEVTIYAISTRVAEITSQFKGMNEKGEPKLERKVTQIKYFPPGEAVPYEYKFNATYGTYFNIATPDQVRKIPGLGPADNDYTSENVIIETLEAVKMPDKIIAIEERKTAAINDYYLSRFATRKSLQEEFDGYRRIHESIVSASRSFKAMEA